MTLKARITKLQERFGHSVATLTEKERPFRRSLSRAGRSVYRSRSIHWSGRLLYVIVFFGGGLGAALRHGVNVWAARLVGTTFPFGTLFINVTGSLAMGIVVGWFAFRTTGHISQHWRLFLTTGFLGGYTTFSAFSLEAALLIERHEYLAAGAYALGSVLLGLVALFIGIWLARIV